MKAREFAVLGADEFNPNFFTFLHLSILSSPSSSIPVNVDHHSVDRISRKI